MKSSRVSSCLLILLCIFIVPAVIHAQIQAQHDANGGFSKEGIFGVATDPPDTFVNLYHKDLIGTWFVVPYSGTIDTVFFQVGNSVGAYDSILFIRIHHSNIEPGVGPGYSYPDPPTKWGYRINTYDADQGISPYIEEATDTTWYSTIDPPSFDPFGLEIWGYGGFPTTAHANQINFCDLGIFGGPSVTEGEVIFVTLRANFNPGNVPGGHVGPGETPTKILASSNRKYPTSRVWKFFEHDSGWQVLDGLNVNIWVSPAIPTFTIQASAGPNGSISPMDAVVVDPGTTQKFIISPDAGYGVDSLFVDNLHVDSTTSYTFHDVNSNHSIRAAFRYTGLTEGLVAFYPFNGNADDSTGSGLDGALNGPIPAPDRFGNDSAAYRFDGVDDFISMPPVVSTDTFSVSVWFRPDENSESAFYYQGANEFAVGFLDSNILNFGIKLTDGWHKIIQDTGDVIPYFHKWNNVVATYSRGEKLRLYVNTQLLAISPTVPSLDYWQAPESSSFGAVYGAMNFYRGVLDDIKFYNRALNETDIDALYHEGGWTPPIKMILATSGPHGKIAPLDTVYVDSAGTQTFTITPDTGYHIDSVIVDGILTDSTTSYTFSDVATDHTIRVVFGINIYTIHATFGDHGSISPSGELEFGYGSTQRFEFLPDPSFGVTQVLVDGGVVDSTGGYTFANITENHTIHVIFTRIRNRSGITVSQSVYEKTLYFGVRSGASYGIWGVDPDAGSIDSSEGEVELSPLVGGEFGARFIDPRNDFSFFGQGSWIDIRNFNRSAQKDSHLIKIQRVPGGDPVVLRWSSSEISGNYYGSVTLEKNPSILVDMKSTDSLVVTTVSTNELYIITNSPNLPVIFESGWNLVSLPVDVVDGTIGRLFPGVSSLPWSYDVLLGYQPEPVIEAGPGYWFIFPSVIQTQSYTGTPRSEDTIDVSVGWNLVGSLTDIISVSSIGSDPPGIITSRFFGYDRGYFKTDSLEPRRGYWVKVTQTGQLFMSSTTNYPGKIVIKPTNELPPPPPGESAQIAESIPTEYSLTQNYPNPFNPVTTIHYTLPEKSYVRLELFNILGQVVNTLVDGEMEAGEKSIQWNASSLPSGVYFYRLTAGSYTGTKKMLLLK